MKKNLDRSSLVPKVGLVSHGGHLTEIQLLQTKLTGVETFLITYKSVRTVPGDRTYLVSNIGTKPWKLVVAFFRISLAIAREKPEALISTGAEIALPAFLIGRALGVKLIFIESLARTTRPSVTGFLLYPVSDLFLVQWPRLLHRYGDRAECVGAVA